MTTQMTRLHQNVDLMPPIVVSEADHERLTSLAAAAEERSPEVASVLRSEMQRARVVPLEAVPANVVRMGSTVEISSDGKRRRVTLVFPGDADIAQGRVSIMTPIGAALIGLSAGQSIAWSARDGRKQQLTVLNVERPNVPQLAPDHGMAR